MSTSLATKRVPEVSSGAKAAMVVVFYLLTFLTGGFFLFVGGRLGFVVDLTATVFYVAVAVLFYALNKRAPTHGGEDMSLTKVQLPELFDQQSANWRA